MQERRTCLKFHLQIATHCCSTTNLSMYVQERNSHTCLAVDRQFHFETSIQICFAKRRFYHIAMAWVRILDQGNQVCSFINHTFFCPPNFDPYNHILYHIFILIFLWHFMTFHDGISFHSECAQFGAVIAPTPAAEWNVGQLLPFAWKIILDEWIL